MDGRASPGRLVFDLADALLGAGASFIEDFGKEHRFGGLVAAFLAVRDGEADGENSRGGGKVSKAKAGAVATSPTIASAPRKRVASAAVDNLSPPIDRASGPYHVRPVILAQLHNHN